MTATCSPSLFGTPAPDCIVFSPVNIRVPWSIFASPLVISTPLQATYHPPHLSTNTYLIMLNLIRRISGSVIPRLDRPWRDDGACMPLFACRTRVTDAIFPSTCFYLPASSLPRPRRAPACHPFPPDATHTPFPPRLTPMVPLARTQSQRCTPPNDAPRLISHVQRAPDRPQAAQQLGRARRGGGRARGEARALGAAVARAV